MSAFPLCYEVLANRSAISQLSNYEANQFFSQMSKEIVCSVARFGNGLVCSLRYCYNPDEIFRIKIFLVLSLPSSEYSQEFVDDLKAYFERGTFKYIHLKPQSHKEWLQNLEWVEFIGEVLKSEEFVEPQCIYLAHRFEPEDNSDFTPILEVIARSGKRLILEITIKAHSELSERSTTWRNAIDEMIAQLRSSVQGQNSSTSLRDALEVYEKYRKSYSKSDVYRYSVKALAENRADARVVLEALSRSLSKGNQPTKQSRIAVESRGTQDFEKSKEASLNFDVSEAFLWEGWNKEIEKALIKDAIKVSSKRGLASLADGSLSFSMQAETRDASYLTSFRREPGSAKNSHDPLADIGAESSLSLLSQISSKLPSYRMGDLRLLSRLADIREVDTFFRVSTFTSTVIPNSSAESIFNKNRNLITEDQYVVGIDDEENAVVSSWDDIPHRLVAGVTRSGKSNFISWLIFQFLYSNPKGKIYISDFKGVDFNFLLNLGLNVDIVSSVEACQQQIESIFINEFERRRDLINAHGVQNINDLRNEGIDIQRTLWIIDEAADIADVSFKLKESVEKSLKKYARQGSAFGIHILYCTQFPTPEVITKQVLEQCEEKIVFRVSPEASQRILLCDDAGHISKDNRGRGVLHQGVSESRRFVNTPFMEVPKGTKVRLEDTLWAKLSTINQIPKP